VNGRDIEASQLERIRGVADRVAASRGLEVFDLQFRTESRGWVLRVFLDKPGTPVVTGRAGTTLVDGVTIEDCQQVSGDLGTLLDVEEVISQRYILEVSSPGLDRPLRKADDYRRFTGCLAKIVLSEAVEGQTHVEGRLGGMDGNDVLVEVGKQRTRRIPLAAISRARLEVEF
jgi:ribosome maturation factor RimP